MWPLTWGDPLGRVAGIDYGESVVKFGYSYVADENNIYRKTFDHRAGTPYNEYTYDDLDRLTDVTYHDSDTEAFVMDALGNRTGNQTLREDGTVNFTVDSLTNRYASVGGNSITHDDAGNLATDRQGYVYFYDYENRVVKIEDSSSNDVAEYAYDALGRRIRMIDSVASTTTLYYYNPEWQCLAEYTGAGTHQRYFVYGNYIDEPLVLNDGTNDYYYAHDHLYSTVALTNSIGQTVERYEYDAYGTVHIMDASYNPRTASAYNNPYTFTGRQLDTLDGGDLLRMHYRYREYDTQLGRFTTHDPLGINSHRATATREQLFEWFVVRQQNRKHLDFVRFTDKYAMYDFVTEIERTYKEALWPCRPDLFWVYEHNLQNRMNYYLMSNDRGHAATCVDLYSYVVENPVNAADPAGLSWISRLRDWIRSVLPYVPPSPVGELITLCDMAGDATSGINSVDCANVAVDELCPEFGFQPGDSFYPWARRRLPRNDEGLIIVPE